MVSGFSDHGPVSIARVQRLDCVTWTWHAHDVGLPASADVDYNDGLYGHSLVAHGSLLVVFGGLLSGASLPNPPFYFSTTQFRNGLKQAGTRTSATGSSPWTPTMFSLAKRPGVFLCNEAARRPLEATTPLA